MIHQSINSLRNGLSVPNNFALLVVVALLISIGLIAILTASIDSAATHYNDAWYFVKRQLIFLCFGLCFGFFVYCIPTSVWQRYGWLLYFVSVFFLVFVLIPAVGHKVNGSQRWLKVGPMSFQVSEIIKLLVIVFMASYLVHRKISRDSHWNELFPVILMIGFILLLILLQPDFGAVVVISVAIGSMLFLSGIKLRYCFALMLASGTLMAAMVMLAPYRMRRFVAYLDPWKDQFDSGYQLTQSLIAFGRGEWLGLGLGNSIQKLQFLPESHTDFIFSIVAEELGFVGSLAILMLFSYLIYQLFQISKRSLMRNESFIFLSVSGIAVLMASHVLINIGVATGFLPTKGLTLPFISYGGSSLMVNCGLIALVMRLNFDLDANVTKSGKSCNTKSIVNSQYRSNIVGSKVLSSRVLSQ